MLATILVIDEEDAELACTAECLESAGYAVAGALSAEAALSLVPHLDFDIAVIDIAMWPVNGTQVAKKLASDGRNMRFLFMSGNAGLGMLGCAGPGGADIGSSCESRSRQPLCAPPWRHGWSRA